MVYLKFFILQNFLHLICGDWQFVYTPTTKSKAQEIKLKPFFYVASSKMKFPVVKVNG